MTNSAAKTSISIEAPLRLMILGSREDGRTMVFLGTKEDLAEEDNNWKKSHVPTGWFVKKDYFGDHGQAEWFEVYLPKRRWALIKRLRKLCVREPLEDIHI